MKVLVTGANGVIGTGVCSVLDQSCHQVIRAVRASSGAGSIVVGDLGEHTDWGEALRPGVDVVVHLAGKVPAREDASEVDADQYTRVNALGTANLARQCVESGVKRFIFVSTVKVSGEGREQPYRADGSAGPVGAYAISKWQAEQALWKIAADTGLEIVVLRPPMVYGPGVKGNFMRLMQFIDKRLPLPFDRIQNRRSMIYLGNFVDVIVQCLTHPGAPGKTFLVSDGDDVSTPELIRRVGVALGRRPFLLPVPVSWMRWAGSLLGKRAAVDRLVGSLAVDIALLREDLGWAPPYTMQMGLDVTAQWYRTAQETR